MWYAYEMSNAFRIIAGVKSWPQRSQERQGFNSKTSYSGKKAANVQVVLIFIKKERISDRFRLSKSGL